MEIQLVRHATLLVRMGGKTLLVDPMLDPAQARPPIQNTPNDLRNPLVEMPEVDLGSVEAVLVTHTHADHFDGGAAASLEKGVPVFCQPEDEEALRDHGFTEVRAVGDDLEWEGIGIFRTGGRHGEGEIGERMAPVSGFFLRTIGEPGLYIAGDTIWCPEVEETLERYEPEVAVLNAGAARFVAGGPITMTAEDVAQVCRRAPETKVIAVHMEAINHCLLTRSELRDALAREGLSQRVLIPADGETLEV